MSNNMKLNEQTNRIKQMMGILESVQQIKNKLSKGYNSDEVGELQKVLGIQPVDNKFGNVTEKCVKEFQKQNNIKPTGVVGNLTKQYLLKLENKEISWTAPEFCKMKSNNVETKLTETNVTWKPELEVCVKNSGGRKDEQNVYWITTKEGKWGYYSDGRFHKEGSNKWNYYTCDGNKIKYIKSTYSDLVILLGGLDTRPGDKSIDQQVDSMKVFLSNKNVKGFRYFDVNGAAEEIKKNPDAYVVLFSKGCEHASTISKLVGNKNNLFIVEPYATSTNTANSVKSAVDSGVPSKNVITGPNTDRGAGVVSGASKTPTNQGHWDALKNVGLYFPKAY